MIRYSADSGRDRSGQIGGREVGSGAACGDAVVSTSLSERRTRKRGEVAAPRDDDLVERPSSSPVTVQLALAVLVVLVSGCGSG